MATLPTSSMRGVAGNPSKHIAGDLNVAERTAKTYRAAVWAAYNPPHRME